MADTWSPYVAWMKRASEVEYNLMGSNLLHCRVDDIPGAREAFELEDPHDEGYGPLVEAIGQRFGVSPETVSLATGASGANFLACSALVRQGDEVVVETPVYDPLLGIPRFLGARIRRFERVFEDGFQIDPDRVAAAVTPATRLIIVTNLHNPTGALTEADRMKALGEVADRVGAKVLVDEVYLDSVPGEPRPPAATLSPTFLSTCSLTKAYGLSGIRAGWAVAAPEITEAVKNVRDIVDCVGAFPAELLAYLAFRNLPSLRERARAILDPNFELLDGFMDGRPELSWVRPGGGSVGFPRIEGVDDVSSFVATLRESYGTGVVPGRFFEAPAHFRIAMGGRRDVLEEGLRRLGEALDKELMR